MAAHERPVASISSSILLSKLAKVLPKDVTFRIHHLSTPPTRTSAIYSAPPNTRPDRTFCESHFLAVSIAVPSEEKLQQEREVLVFAIEVLIYSTVFDTTFFVSKADSTGYLHLLELPKGTSSPIKAISSAFVRHLLETHKRPGIRSVVSLFARAQDQYLFPGSVEYSGKHVLDDRGLVRWWCRVLDPVIEDSTASWPADIVHGYLTVPGLDLLEYGTYIPKRSTVNKSWTVGNPLREISHWPREVPPRCLIPHFPDDPKARFLDELDEEITKGNNASGNWKSVRSLEQFWEMMAYRQECSSGRLVGFIWVVFTPETTQLGDSSLGLSQSSTSASEARNWEKARSQTITPAPTPATSFCNSSQTNASNSPIKIGTSQSHPAVGKAVKQKPVKKKKKLAGPIIPRQPQVKTENKNYLPDRPETTAYYSWTSEARGQVVLDEADYKRSTELLLHLDFANLELATSSTNRWTDEVRCGAWGTSKENWGQTVTGTKAIEARAFSSVEGVTTLNMSSIRKKRKDAPVTAPPTPPVNVLSVGAIRKKPKV